MTKKFLPPLFALIILALAPAVSAQQESSVTLEEALAIMVESAENGDPEAMVNLGSLYEQGLGVPRNFLTAFEWYKKAAEKGLAEGYYNVGVSYEIGLGNSGDLELALENFHQAASLGLSQAFKHLSEIYLAGSRVPRDEALGFDYLKKAAEAGHLAAMNEMGLIYTQGLLGESQDAQKALDWFLKAAEAGNLESIKNVAVSYKDGLGVAASPVDSLKWYLVARGGGLAAPDLETTVDQLKISLTGEQIVKAEKDAATWLEDFEKRRAAARTAPDGRK